MIPLRPAAAMVVLALVVGAAPGCGGGSGSKTASAATSGSTAQLPFPRAEGHSIQQLAANLPSGPILAPSIGVLRPGSNRFGFGIFDPARKQITGAQVGLYVAGPDGSNVRGPFAVRSESLAVEPRFQSRTNAQDPNAATSVYVSQVTLPRTKTALAWAVARLDGRLVATSVAQLAVGASGPPPAGARAPRVHTPTSPPSPIASIDTRIPPDSMHSVDFAGVLGRKPVLLVFATPQLCQSRTCGPVVDEAAQLQATYGRRMAFIHMEIYNNNRIQDGYRPQVKAWNLPSEPWTFAIDRHGRIAAEIEGPASVAELRQAIAKALR